MAIAAKQLTLAGYRTLSADYSISVTSDRNALLEISTAANRTITLPTAASAGAGFSVSLRKSISSTNSNAVTVNRSSPDTIDGATSFVLAIPGEFVQLVSDGSTSWLVTNQQFPVSGTPGLYGDGSDGDVTISSSVTLTQNRFYNNLTITGAGNLNTAGFLVFVRGTLLIQSGGVLRTVGNNASGGTAGGGAGNTVAGNGIGGGAGGGGANGTNTSTANASGLSGQGGNGGASGGGQTGGTAGVTTGQVASAPRHLVGLLTGGLRQFNATTNFLLGGNGGGGGGGSMLSTGGGGGGGAPNLFVFAQRIINSGSINSTGGNGGSGTLSSGTGAGGGGGGGGGHVALAYRYFTGNTPTSTGGTGGAAAGTGSAGSNGNGGVVSLYPEL